MKNRVLLTSAYLAPIQYYTKLLAYPQATVEQFDHYIKQSYRNRCVILGAGGPLSLTIPISTDHDKSHTPMNEVRLSEHGRWRHLHWEALVSAYERSPYFEYYADYFHPFYEEGRFELLIDFNEAMQQLVCQLLGIEAKTQFSDLYEKNPEDADDFREKIHPKRDWSSDLNFSPTTYFQVFGQTYGFCPNLSIVDLLFNQGPEGIITLKKSIHL